MTATPDSFSMADLEAFLSDAPQDITDQEPVDRKTHLIEISENAIQNVVEPLNGEDAAQVHKIILHIIVTHMIEWHSKVSASAFSDGETMAAIGWARDAGKFQAIANILDTIEVGDDDFTCTTNR